MLKTHTEEEETPTMKEKIQAEREKEEISRMRQMREYMEEERRTRAWARRWPRRRTELRRKDGRLLG